jgi:hypothetical protein
MGCAAALGVGLQGEGREGEGGEGAHAAWGLGAGGKPPLAPHHLNSLNPTRCLAACCPPPPPPKKEKKTPRRGTRWRLACLVKAPR